MKSMLTAFLRQAAVAGYEGQFKTSGVRVEEITGDPKVLGQWMSLALVAAPSIRITFKAHFNSSHLSDRFASNDDAESTRLARDAMNEFANIVVGILKTGLRSSGVDAGMSLPLSMRGFNEIYFECEDSEHVIVDYWTIQSRNRSLHCSAVVEVLDPDAIRSAGTFTVRNLGDVEWLKG